MMAMRKKHTRFIVNHLSSAIHRNQELKSAQARRHSLRLPNNFTLRAYSTENPKDATDATKPSDEGTFAKLLSTVRHFNNGLSRLKSDVLISLHIRDAIETRWHLDRKLRQQRHDEKRNTQSDTECPSLIQRRNKWLAKHLPKTSTRRSQRHLIQTTKDLQTTLPTVLGFLIPVAGYAFLVLGLMFPKVLLSRQFHTADQRREFAMDEYGVCRGWFGVVASDFWGSFMIDSRRLKVSRRDGIVLNAATNETLRFDSVDMAGPVLDESSMLHLYESCRKLVPCGAPPHKSNAFSNLPISHLHSLSLACNLSSILPLPSSISQEMLQSIFPRRFLESRLESMAEDIIMDDATLIEEGHRDDSFSNLTRDEIMDACLTRGLPVGRFAKDATLKGTDEVSSMRTMLANHMRMMQGVMMVRESFSLERQHLITGGVGIRSKSSLVRDPALQLLVLHLSPLRYAMRSQQKSRADVL